MTKKIITVISAIVSLLAVSITLAQGDAPFAKANQEYADGRFKEAIAEYEALARNGESSANLFYNLGNAYFRTRDFGNAILNYERALALDPHHAEAEANLKFVRDEGRALELPQGRGERYLHCATKDQYGIAAAIAFWLGVFGIARLIFSRRRSGMLMTLSVLSLAAFALLVTIVMQMETSSQAQAIVTGDATQARVATAETANSVLALPPGSEVRILSERGEWIYAALPNNLRGWIPAKSARRVQL
jgi:tetratricopeptide (TPR) repeat protein